MINVCMLFYVHRNRVTHTHVSGNGCVCVCELQCKHTRVRSIYKPN